MTLTVHPLDVGDLQLDMTFRAWQTSPGTSAWRPTTAWLILGGDGPILVDSSFRSVADAAALQGLVARRSPEQELPAQLARHGLEPGDVGAVVHTHLHMDHAGQDHLLPEARIVVRRAELQNAAAPNLYPVPVLRPPQRGPHPSSPATRRWISSSTSGRASRPAFWTR